MGPPTCDLHTHTWHSDGVLSPEELVTNAARRGVQALAVTDHDTLDGVQPAVVHGRSLGVEVVAGIELSVDFEGLDLHLLGYFVRAPRRLEPALARLRRLRLERARRMLEKLASLGYALDFKGIEQRARGGVVGRPHVAEELVERGHVLDVQDAFDRLLGQGKPAYVPKWAPALAEGIELLHQSGALAVLAHPHASGCEAHIPALVRAGVRGLEVWHPTHDAPLVRRYLRLARRHGLLPTGGSDFHRELPGGILPGDVGVSRERLEELRRAAG